MGSQLYVFQGPRVEVLAYCAGTCSFQASSLHHGRTLPKSPVTHRERCQVEPRRLECLLSSHFVNSGMLVPIKYVHH